MLERKLHQDLHFSFQKQINSDLWEDPELAEDQKKCEGNRKNMKESKIYSCWLCELNLMKHIKLLFSFMTAKID